MSGRDGMRWRMLDTGLRRAAENLALNQALLGAHAEHGTSHTLRFLRFYPCALVGFHQDIGQEIREDYCREQGVEIQRRLTGGGAIYFDETALGWELYLDKKTLGTGDMAAISARICEAAANGIRRLGVDARYRPRNDIEVDGRKISGTGGSFDGDAILFQGTLLIDFDVEHMLRVLRVPAEKLSDKAIASAQDRVANLKSLLGYEPSLETVQSSLAAGFAEAFGIDLEPAEQLEQVEVEGFREALAEIDTPEWVYQRDRPAASAPLREGFHRAAGGLIRAAVLVDESRDRLKQLWLTGDFFVHPRRMVADLEAALRDTRLSELEANVHAFFDRYPVEMLMLGRDDFVQAIRAALAESGPDQMTAT